MNRFLPQYLGMYAALLAVVWFATVQIGLFNTATVLIPGPLGALVGRWFVKHESRFPTKNERLTFATLATIFGELVYLAVLTGCAYAWTSVGSATFTWNPGTYAAPYFWLYQLLPTMMVTWPLVYFGTFLGAHDAAQNLPAEQSPEAP